MIKEGVFLGKRYEILGRVGSGGMADVYKGKDHKLNRYVAIKVLKSDYRSDQVFIQKFLSEAQAAAGLMHPNVVNVYDVGQDRGLYYMVMELVEGITLKDYIQKKGKLSAKETISISIQMVTGIQAAHNRHIIHRDIKPQNIIISKEGKVKVTDFGIARATTSTQTISASVMGSVHYTSPEQARGGRVDEKSDIYSAGITMYEMITGHVPFDGDSTVSVALKHLQEEIVSPSKEVPDIPYSLECIIMKCTQKNPERRYHDCESLLLDLKRSLVDPDGDFVITGSVAAAAPDSDRTVVMSTEELEQLQNQRYDDEDDEYDDDYDEDEYDDEDEEDDDDYQEERRKKKDVNPDTKKIMRILLIVAGVIVALLVIFLVGNAVGVFSGPGITATTEKQVDVPDVRGMTEDEARDELNDKNLGMRVSGREASDEYDKGEIISQDPGEGEKVDEHTTIEVVVSTGPETKMVQVPNVVDAKEADAEKEIEDAGLIVKKEFEASDDVDAGRVISVSPDAGTEVEEGSEVTIVVSTGPETKMVAVPKLVGREAADAEAALTSAGLVGSVTEQYSDEPVGQVISQSPLEGEQVEEGSTVSYVVSLGPETKTVTVPNLTTGMTREEAEQALTAAGLKVGTVTEANSSSITPGYVMNQTISPGTEVAEGTAVGFTVSIGPESSGGSSSGDSDTDNTN
ncbi:MAG: Stk1 family PASTA domain-containing Ser/Thr kinase [Mediterraneibacter sp.]